MQFIKELTTVLDDELKIIMQLKNPFLFNQDSWVKRYKEEDVNDWATMM